MNLPYKAYAISEAGSLNLSTVAQTEEEAKANWLELQGIPPFAFHGNITVTEGLFEQKAKESKALIACVPVEVRQHEPHAQPQGVWWLDEHGTMHRLAGTKPDRDVAAGMAAKVEELVDRLDGTDRTIEALRQGLNDVTNVANDLSDRVMARNITSIHRRLASRDATLAEFERRISQIEDTAHKDRRGAHSDRETMWPRLGELAERITKLEARTQEQQVQINNIGEKGSVIGGAINRERAATQVDSGSYAYPAERKCLGYINLYEIGRGMTFHSTRFEADERALTYPARRVACVEVFEGDGLI